LIDYTKQKSHYSLWCWLESLSSVRSIQSNSSHPVSSRYTNIIFPSQPHLEGGIFPSGFPTNSLHAFLFSPILSICLSHLIPIGSSHFKRRSRSFSNASFSILPLLLPSSQTQFLYPFQPILELHTSTSPHMLVKKRNDSAFTKNVTTRHWFGKEKTPQLVRRKVELIDTQINSSILQPLADQRSQAEQDVRQFSRQSARVSISRSVEEVTSRDIYLSLSRDVGLEFNRISKVEIWEVITSWYRAQSDCWVKLDLVYEDVAFVTLMH